MTPLVAVHVYRDGSAWVANAPEWLFTARGRGAMQRAMDEARKRTEAKHLPASEIVLGRRRKGDR